MKSFTLVFFSSIIIIFCSLITYNQAYSDNKKDNTKGYSAMEKEFAAFADKIEAKMDILYHNQALTSWTASITGKDADYEIAAKADMDWNKYLSDKELFKQVKKYKTSNEIHDPMLKRRLLLIYNSFAGDQIDTVKLNAMSIKQSEITKKYSNFRAKVGSKEYTDNDIEDVLANSKDSKELQDVWLAHKKIGPLVAKDIIELVKMRNEAAHELGYKNFYEMNMLLNQQNPKDILRIYDELDNLTKDAYKKLKVEIDNILSKQLKIKPEDMMPWHYQNRYFQQAPKIYDVDLDKYYAGKDVVKLVSAYYKSMGMPIDDMIAKSDLYEKPGKNQHAYSTDIDRDTKDTRVLCNVKNNCDWMKTLLHEFGHSVYFKYEADTLPWILKAPAHTFTTEAIAEMFGRFGGNAQWMCDMKVIDEKEKNKIENICHKYLRLEQLCFSRWSQVMFRFEMALYDNPDQDLNKLWWTLVEKYQLVKPPAGRNEPDWATKIHIATSPCYYHNYLLGEMLASQFYYYVKEKLLYKPELIDASFYNSTVAGNFFKDKVFAPGAKYYWDDMIKNATGERLTAKYYAKQFVK